MWKKAAHSAGWRLCLAPCPAAGGLLYHHLGPAALFRLSGLVVLAGTAACSVAFVALRWRRKAAAARDAAAGPSSSYGSYGSLEERLLGAAY